MKNINLKEQILKLRSEGKTYNEIRDLLNCSKGTIAHHCGDGQKNKSLERMRKYRLSIKNQNAHKLDNFCRAVIKKNVKNKIEKFSSRKEFITPVFKYQDVMNKFGENPVCYLTGRPLDWLNSKDLSFDHIVPRSKGGDNTIDNLGVCCAEANFSKSALSLESYLALCKEVLENFGYQVTKPD